MDKHAGLMLLLLLGQALCFVMLFSIMSELRTLAGVVERIRNWTSKR